MGISLFVREPVVSSVGRNDPCPCGSGRKYKKCCLGTETEKAEVRFQEQRTAARRSSQGLGVGSRQSPSAYAISKAAEREEILQHMPAKHRQAIMNRWTPRKVRALDTEEILRRLAEIGLAVTPGSFGAEAEGKTSAWKLGAGWATGLGRKLSTDDDDFVCHAACVLWSRFLPDRPSVEMVDDWMQDGYDAPNSIAMCEHWLKVWAYFKQQFRPELRRPWDLDDSFPGLQSFSGWIQDFMLELINASLESKAFAAPAIEVYETFLAQFPDDAEVNVRGNRKDLAEIYCIGGDQQMGERLMERVVADWPGSAIGYIGMSEALGFRKQNGLAVDVTERIGWLEKARAVSPEEAADFDIDERIADLEKEGN